MDRRRAVLGYLLLSRYVKAVPGAVGALLVGILAVVLAGDVDALEADACS